MQQRYPIDPKTVKTFTTEQLREHFLVETLFTADAITA